MSTASSIQTNNINLIDKELFFTGVQVYSKLKNFLREEKNWFDEMLPKPKNFHIRVSSAEKRIEKLSDGILYEKVSF